MLSAKHFHAFTPPFVHADAHDGNRSYEFGVRADSARHLTGEWRAVNFVERAVLLTEAFSAKHSVKLAPEPSGPQSGIAYGTSKTAHVNREAEPLTITAVGDSMVAGCGVNNTTLGLIPDFANDLAEQTGRPVHWSIMGKLGATMRRVRYRMLPAVAKKLEATPRKIDVLVICAGSNDVMARRSVPEWRDDLTAVIEKSQELASHIVVLSSGQLYKSPSLGKMLRQEAERRIDEQTAVSAEVCTMADVTYVDLTHEPLHADANDFWASDHFHPSELGYRLIAQAIIKKMRGPLLATLTSQTAPTAQKPQTPLTSQPTQSPAAKA